MISLDALRSDAERLLREGTVKLVMGYRARDERRVPILLTQSEHTDLLFYDDLCKHNLAAYLRKTEVRDLFPLAIVARPEVMRSLLVLSAESQIPAGAVTVLGVSENEYHGVLDLPAVAKLLKERFADLSPDEALLAKVREIAAMSPEDRAAFWSEVFSHCTRCYACRAACPGCYCQWCLAKKNVPQWISAVVRPHGNYAWNIIRAFHHAGRCTLCGACEAACPQKLPLMLLNV
jgi:formate dehydrogenase (coenzyme F420) beta subunit